MKHTLVLLVIGIPAWCCLVLSKIFWGQVQYNELEEFSTVTKSQHMHGRFSQNCLFWAEETCVLPLVSDDISMEFRAIFFSNKCQNSKIWTNENTSVALWMDGMANIVKYRETNITNWYRIVHWLFFFQIRQCRHWFLGLFLKYLSHFWGLFNLWLPLH